jgi:hypothetical protein
LLKASFTIRQVGSADLGIYLHEDTFRRESQAASDLFQRRRRVLGAGALDSEAHLFTPPPKRLAAFLHNFPTDLRAAVPDAG